VTFFLDQDVPDDLAHWLRHRGHSVTCLRDVLPTSATDFETWEWARAHAAVFVSCNRNDVLALPLAHSTHRDQSVHAIVITETTAS
jgi:predicted nuclease of predicted toxin-antitoxin system